MKFFRGTKNNGMNIALVDTLELRKTGQLKQAWNDGARSRDSLMSSARLLAALPPEVKGFCAWGTVYGARSNASVESLAVNWKRA